MALRVVRCSPRRVAAQHDGWRAKAYSRSRGQRIGWDSPINSGHRELFWFAARRLFRNCSGDLVRCRELAANHLCAVPGSDGWRYAGSRGAAWRNNFDKYWGTQPIQLINSSAAAVAYTVAADYR
jgi:hypothetical protein